MLLVALAFVSCKKPADCGDLSVNIGYSINGNPLITDSLCYHNEAGNEFMITEIQWFISNMELQNEHGAWNALEPKIFYIDTNIPESQTLRMNHVPTGHYKALRFTFGLDENDNRTGLFNNPPELEMFWPEPLGGGYHYMKLNGKYLDAEGRLAPMAIHLGIGQNEDCTEFYQNYFIAEIPIDFNVKTDIENQLDLTMVIDNWFRNPNTIDFNEFGSHIMQNQAAQQALKENGHDVFTISNEEKDNNIAMKKDGFLKGFTGFMRKAAPKPHFWSWENAKERFQNPTAASRHCEASFREDGRSNPDLKI